MGLYTNKETVLYTYAITRLYSIMFINLRIYGTNIYIIIFINLRIYQYVLVQ